jgi:hypothetical protein
MKEPKEMQVSASDAALAAQKAADEARKAEAARVKARDDKSLASMTSSADRAAEKDKKVPAKITVTFTGDPKGGADPENPEYAGKSFPKGVAVVVDDPAWIRQNGDNIRSNNHFRVE